MNTLSSMLAFMLDTKASRPKQLQDAFGDEWSVLIGGLIDLGIVTTRYWRADGLLFEVTPWRIKK